MVTKSKKQAELSPEMLEQLAKDSGSGMEGADAGCFAVNYLTVLQPLSPQVNKKKDEYIKGAEAGMLYNTGTGEVFDGDEGIEIVPVGFERIVNIWRPDRGGFAGRMQLNDPRYAAATPGAKGTKDEFKMFDKDGNELADTRNHFILILKKDGGFDMAVMSCSHSKIKISGKFMSKLRGILLPRSDGTGKFNPPTFAYSYRLRTYLDSNNRGDEYFNFTVPEIENRMLDNPEMYEESRNANKQITDGKMQVAIPAEASESATEAEIVDEGQM